MSLKSIRESYTSLINAFAEAGVKLDESQKSSLDAFVVALECKMRKQKEDTVRATKKVVVEHLEKEYKKVFESILKAQRRNAELAAKIQSKVQSINESKQLARKVGGYLDLYVESVLPEKTIVDYDRMRKLENLHESLKDLLVADEDAVVAKKQQLSEKFSKAKRDYETKIAKLTAQLGESMAKTRKLSGKIEQFKAMELLESKTKDLPTFEARAMKKRLTGATVAEIENSFKKVYESVKKEIEEDEAEQEASLESEIQGILDAECSENKPEVEENDMLRGRNHNAHVAEDENEENPTDEAEPIETMETYKFDRNGDIVLEGEDIIDAAYMKQLCQMAQRIG